MQVLAIIPARGGSKGIPEKNIRILAGKPLIAYTIGHARQTPSVKRIVVSTDDPEIAAVSEQYGAEVVWRHAEISDDTATSESALLHVLNHLKDAEAYEPGLIAFLQATSPLRRHDDIQNAIDKLQQEQADSLLSVCPLHGFLWRKEGDKISSFNYDYHHRQRCQEAPEDLVENGSFYLFRPWVLQQLNNRLGGNIAVYHMDWLDSFDINEPSDLKLIEHLLNFRQPRPQIENIRLLVLDFDGVMTDNRVLVNQDGTEAVWCDRGDGLGIAQLKKTGIEVIVLSAEVNPVVNARCQKLKTECIQSCDHKFETLQKLAKERSVASENIAYIGNDVNDLECLRWVGLPIAVADAVPEVKSVVKLITTQPGGRGAVREVIDLMLKGISGNVS